jgi:transposase InsO family protein
VDNCKIGFRPIKTRSPHLNDKVERAQRTDREEFYAQADMKSPQLPHHLTQWQEFYNKCREHGPLCYETPWQRWEEWQAFTPSNEEIRERYEHQKNA